MAYRFDELSVTDAEAGTVTLRGDGFAAAGEMLSLLESADVRHFLAMSPAEISRANDIAEQYRAALKQVYESGNWKPPQLDPATAEARRRLAEETQALLGPDRFVRFERLSWRIRGADALIDDRVAAALHLTEEQRQKLADTAQRNETDQAQALKALSAVRLREHKVLEDRGVEAHDAGQKRLLQILSPVQRKALARLMKGKS